MRLFFLLQVLSYNREMKDLTWIELNTKSLSENIETIRSRTSSEIMFVLKANAYGHGLEEVTKLLVDQEVDIVGVESVYELAAVRAAGFKGRLILIGPFEEGDIVDIINNNVEVTIFEIEKIKILNLYAKDYQTKITFHLKIETGLHRQGLAKKDISLFCEAFKKTNSLYFKAVTTHFANIEDVEDYAFSQQQFALLQEAQKEAEDILSLAIGLHAANSGATLMYPEFHGEMVRVGVILYGLYPSSSIKEFCMQHDIFLKPVLSWKTKIMHIHEMQSGETLGYGRTYTAQKKTRIALLPVGYYDGYHRAMRGQNILVQGALCPLVGTICMNMMMCDISSLFDTKVGDDVVLIGDQHENISADFLAEKSGTINYELVTIINSRIPRRLL